MTDERSHTKRRDTAVLRGALATGATRLITTATAFVTLGIAARTLRPDEFGLVTVLVSLWLIVTVLDLGIGGSLTVRVSQGYARENYAEIRQHFNHALLALTIVGGFIAIGGTLSVFVLPWHDWVGGKLDPSTVTRALIITWVVSGLTLPANVGVGTLSAMQRFTVAKSCLVAGALLTMVATASVAMLHPPPEAYVLIIVGAPLAVSIGFTAWVRFGILRHHPAATPLRPRDITSLVLTSRWFALILAATAIGGGSGAIVVSAVMGPADAGTFNVATRLLSPIITVVGASGGLIWAGMTEAITRGDVAWAASRYKRGLLAVLVVSSAIGIALTAIGPQLAELWVGSDLRPSRSLFAWASVGTVSIAVASQAGVILMAVQRLRAAAAVTVGAAVVSIGVSIGLTRAIGLNGAAIGLAVGYLGVMLPGIALLASRTLRSLSPLVSSPSAN